MNGILKKILSVALLVLIFGCSEQYRNHGYIPSEEELSSVSVSQDDKNSVIEKLGTPSIGGILNDGNIYSFMSVSCSALCSIYILNFLTFHAA